MREADGPRGMSAPWWAWLLIGICLGMLLVLL